MQVLVVDDSKMSREILRASLVKSGHVVETVDDGKKALEVLGSRHFRLVISDWEMPGMSGVDLCRKIRSADFPGYIYVILVTAREKRDKLEALVAGADDFISKPFSPEDLALRVRCAERTVAVHIREAALFSLAALIETRGPMTSRHLQRVRSYSRLIAQDLAGRHCFANVIDAEFVRNLVLAAPLHDIGNAAIPDLVLSKQGKLTDAEFNIVKSHPVLGAKAIDAAALEYPESTFFVAARRIILTHHERFDGMGYPSGLKGEDIPLEGRIVSVADAYDSITSGRVYRSAHSLKKGISMISQDAGTRFDPGVIEAFLRVEPQILQAAAQFRDREK